MSSFRSIPVPRHRNAALIPEEPPASANRSSVRIENKKQETKHRQDIKSRLYLPNLARDQFAQWIKNKAGADADRNIKREAHQRHHGERRDGFRVVGEIDACNWLQHE